MKWLKVHSARCQGVSVCDFDTTSLRAEKCSLRLSDLLQSLRANSATENLQENGAFRGTWTAKSAKACDASHQPWVWKQFLASLLFSLSTCRLCGSVDTSLVCCSHFQLAVCVVLWIRHYLLMLFYCNHLHLHLWWQFLTFVSFKIFLTPKGTLNLIRVH